MRPSRAAPPVGVFRPRAPAVVDGPMQGLRRARSAVPGGHPSGLRSVSHDTPCETGCEQRSRVRTEITGANRNRDRGYGAHRPPGAARRRNRQPPAAATAARNRPPPAAATRNRRPPAGIRALRNAHRSRQGCECPHRIGRGGAGAGTTRAIRAAGASIAARDFGRRDRNPAAGGARPGHGHARLLDGNFWCERPKRADPRYPSSNFANFANADENLAIVGTNKPWTCMFVLCHALSTEGRSRLWIAQSCEATGSPIPFRNPGRAPATFRTRRGAPAATGPVYSTGPVGSRAQRARQRTQSLAGSERKVRSLDVERRKATHRR